MSDRFRDRNIQLFLVFMTGLVALFGILEVFGNFLNINLNFEEQIFPIFENLGSIPIGKMSFSTGAFFFVEGFVVFGLLDRSKSKKIYKISGLIASIVILSSLIFILAYVFNAPLLYNTEEVIPMAFTTALAFLTQGFSMLFKTDFNTFPLLYFSKKKTSGLIFGTFLPISIISVFISPLFIELISSNSNLNTPTITSAVVIFNFIINSIIIYFSSRNLGKSLDTTLDERINAEKKLLKAQKEATNLVTFPAENPNPVLKISSDGKVKFKNKASIPVLNHWKYKEEGILADNYLKIIENVLKTGVSQEIEEEYGEKYTSLTFTPLKDTGEVNIYGLDITKRKKSELELQELNLELEKYSKSLEQSISEKDNLLKELHHRVKNNLQIISAITIMQEQKVDGNCLKIFKDFQNRIKAMAKIHETLYKSENIGKLKINDYISGLIDNLIISYNINTERIQIELEIETIDMDLRSGMYYGLIINELISNSLKYAFPNKNVGKIVISTKKNDDNSILLKIKDNGIGIPDEIDYLSPETMGLKIVSILVEQLKAKISLNRDKGTEWTITFTT